MSPTTALQTSISFNNKAKLWEIGGAVVAVTLFLIPAYLLLAPGQITYTNRVLTEVLTVSPSGYEYTSFVIPSEATSVHIQGSFTASGGSGDDIYVIVMDEINFVHWKNGHESESYYASGQLIITSFDVSLPAGRGTYYLVYSNMFDRIWQKHIQTIVSAIYTV